MARYYFHLRDGGDLLLDPEGAELDGPTAAWAQAMRAARAILAAEVLEGRLPLHMRIDVEDVGGALVHRLPFAEAVNILLDPAQA